MSPAREGYAHNAFKIELAKRAIVRALVQAVKMESDGDRQLHRTSQNRVDGPAKVTGAAKYAADVNVPGLAYGVVVSSAIAKGRITRIDASRALAVPGVIQVFTHENRPATSRG